MKSAIQIVFLAVTLATPLSWSAEIRNDILPGEIRVQDLQPSKIIGLLGVPLGTDVIIGGTLAERTMLANALEISEIAGEKLPQPVAIEIQGNLKIQKGTQYRLEGYESGEFAGQPVWGNSKSLPQQPFQFHSFFIVTKVLEPTPAPKKP